MSGLEKKIKIYELHPIFMDASLKGELIGHENLITSFTLISNTPMLISADDKGKVKLWDFRNLICLQTIDFSDKTVITNLLDMIDIGKVGVFGSRVNFI
jgi:WD40 repeat protein